MGKGSKLRIITAAVIVALALLMMFTGGVSAKFTNKALELRAGLFDSETIEYADIVSAELRTDLDLGSRSFGASNVFLDSGTFKNDEFGSYKIFADKKVKTYVVIRHSRGVSVYNLSDAASTAASLETLLGKFGK